VNEDAHDFTENKTPLHGKSVADAVGVVVSLGVNVGETDGVIVSDGATDALSVGEALSVAESEAEDVAVSDGVNVTVQLG
jgi:hypothetical protein